MLSIGKETTCEDTMIVKQNDNKIVKQNDNKRPFRRVLLNSELVLDNKRVPPHLLEN